MATNSEDKESTQKEQSKSEHQLSEGERKKHHGGEDDASEVAHFSIERQPLSRAGKRRYDHTPVNGEAKHLSLSQIWPQLGSNDDIS